MATSSAPGLLNMPGGPELIEYLRAQRAKGGIATPADVNAAASTTAGIPRNMTETEAPSGGMFMPTAETAGGEGASVLSSLGGLAKRVIPSVGIAAPLIKPAWDLGSYLGGKFNQMTGATPAPQQPGTLPDINGTGANPENNSVVASKVPEMSAALAALTGAGGQPAGSTSQPSSTQPPVGFSNQPTSANDTQGAGSQSTNDGGVGPVPVSQETQGINPTSSAISGPVNAPGSQTNTPVTQQSTPPPVGGYGNPSVDQTNQPAGNPTFQQLLDMLSKSTMPANQWQPTPVQPPAGAQNALDQVTKPNAASVTIDGNGNAPGVGKFQRFLAAGAGPFDWHRADFQRVALAQQANALTEKEKLAGGVAASGVQGADQANTQLQQGASAAGGISPQMKMIMDILGGSVGAQSAASSKIREIGAQGQVDIAKQQMANQPELAKLNSDYMQRAASLKMATDIAEKYPDLMSPAQITKITGGSATSDDYENIKGTLSAITRARGFDPQKIAEAQLLMTILPSLQSRLSTLGPRAAGAATAPSGGTAPGSGGRPSNLNLTALQH